MSEVQTDFDLKDLQKKIPCQWRVQSVNKNAKTPFAILIPYIDSRQAQELLDDVVGPANWQDRYSENKGNIYCEVGIKINNEWVWKSDVGSESNIEKSKGESSDSFKRACVKWGVGRFLYSTDPIKVKAVEVKGGKWLPYCEPKKSALWSGDVLSKYVNYCIDKNLIDDRGFIQHG